MNAYQIIRNILLAIVLVGAGYWFMLRMGFARDMAISLALLFTAPLLGFLAAKIVRNFSSSAYEAARDLALADREGRVYAYRGWNLDVIEDEFGYRWLRSKDLREKVLPQLPDDAKLQVDASLSTRHFSGESSLHIKAESLAAHLQTHANDEQKKFLQWLGREVIEPAANARERNRQN